MIKIGKKSINIKDNNQQVVTPRKKLQFHKKHGTKSKKKGRSM